MHERVELSREVAAVAIPSGESFVLPEGTSVVVTQSLGGSYTVMTNLGQLARIDGKDADAIGKQAGAEPTAVAQDGPVDREKVEEIVWDLLRTCYDPEIPVNIVDLGLIYGCTVRTLDEGKHRVDVQMTLTAPGCGMGGVIRADVEAKVRTVPTVAEAEVELVMDPPWDPSRMSEEAKLELGMM